MAMTVTGAKQIGVSLSPELTARLAAICQKEDRTTSWIVRKAIEEFIEREEQKEND